MSNSNLSAAELLPLVAILAVSLDGASRALRNIPRAAELLAPLCVANLRAAWGDLPDWHPSKPAPVTAADLAKGAQAYMLRTPAVKYAADGLRALGCLRYNCDGMTAGETSEMLGVYALVSRAALDTICPREDS